MHGRRAANGATQVNMALGGFTMLSKITGGFVLALASILSIGACAQDGALKTESYETMPVDGVPDVYIFRHGNQQAIFIVTNEGVLATDPMSHKNEDVAAKYLAEIKKKTHNPIKYV